MKPIYMTLKTVAIATDRNGKQYQHSVTLRHSDYPAIPSLVLRIEETPGSWYLSTLLERGDEVGTRLAIDCGQRWDCINMDQIMNEVRSHFGTLINPDTFEPKAA